MGRNDHMVTGEEAGRLYDLEQDLFKVAEGLGSLLDADLTSNRAKFYQRELNKYADNINETIQKLVDCETENVQRKLGKKPVRTS